MNFLNRINKASFNFAGTIFSIEMFPRKCFFKELEHFSYQKTFLVHNIRDMSLIFIIATFKCRTAIKISEMFCSANQLAGFHMNLTLT